LGEQFGFGFLFLALLCGAQLRVLGVELDQGLGEQG
jgi:hypothetical protein